MWWGIILLDITISSTYKREITTYEYIKNVRYTFHFKRLSHRQMEAQGSEGRLGQSRRYLFYSEVQIKVQTE
jgi:hypothetical protein